MPTNTIRLHRVLHAAPEKIYRAFLDPDAMAKWLPPNGFTGKGPQDRCQMSGVRFVRDRVIAGAEVQRRAF